MLIEITISSAAGVARCNVRKLSASKAAACRRMHIAEVPYRQCQSNAFAIARAWLTERSRTSCVPARFDCVSWSSVLVKWPLCEDRSRVRSRGARETCGNQVAFVSFCRCCVARWCGCSETLLPGSPWHQDSCCSRAVFNCFIMWFSQSDRNAAQEPAQNRSDRFGLRLAPKESASQLPRGIPPLERRLPT